MSKIYLAHKNQDEKIFSKDDSLSTLAVQSANVGVWAWDLGKALHLSDEFVHQLGHEKENSTVSLDFWTSRIHPQDLSHFNQAIQINMTSGNDDITCEHRLKVKSGNYHWFLARGKLIRDNESKPLKMVGTLTSIEAHKRKEEHLSSQFNRLGSTLESLTESVITVNSKARITYINSAARKLLELALSDVDSLSIDDVLCLECTNEKNTNDEIIHPVQMCFQQKKTVCTDCCSLITASGKSIPVDLTASPIESDDEGITGAVLILRNISQTRRLQDDLQHQATHDTLTDLWNRRAFEQRLKELQKDARHNNTQHALLYIDLDQFKIVNDTAGHLAGDELLKQVCHQLKLSLRDSDMLSRIGGDEFAVLLNNCPLNNALGIGEKIRAILDRYQFVWEKNAYKISSSIGIAIIDQSCAEMNVLGFADIACYSAKEAGRNRVHLYTPEDEDLQNRQGQMSMISKIQTALEENRFVLYSQAIVPLNTDGKDRSFREVLVRMLDEEGKLVPPDAFIPAAERYGLMSDIDRFVVESSIEWLDAQDDETITLSINLSGASLSNPDMTEYIEGRFHHCQHLAKRICFEVTETAAITNFNDSILFFKRLKKMGFTIALDDFGSGLSSFGYLKSLPIDIVKIDGSFVVNMVDDTVDAAMVEAIVRLSNEMGILCIAEFVEDLETQRMLELYGVEFGQGFFFEVPTPLNKYLNSSLN